MTRGHNASPSFVQSDTVKGLPERIFKIGATFQPPAIQFVTPLPRKDGDVQTADNANRWRMSKSELPRSSCGFKGSSAPRLPMPALSVEVNVELLDPLNP